MQTMISSEELKSNQVKLVIAYILICLIWGSGYPINRIGIASIPPLIFLGGRLLLAGILILSYTGLKQQSLPKFCGELRAIVIPGLLLFLGGNGFGILGLKTVSSGPAALLVAIAPVFMAFFDFLKPGAGKMNGFGWSGLCIGFGGVTLLMLTGSEAQAIDLQGASLILGGAFCWALGSVYNNRVRSNLPFIIQMAGQMAVGGLAVLLLGIFYHGGREYYFTWPGLAAFGYMLVFDALFANCLYLYLLRAWPSAKVGTYAYITPFIAGFIGFLFLNEPISLKLVSSGIITLSGVFLVQKSYSGNYRRRNNARA